MMFSSARRALRFQRLSNVRSFSTAPSSFLARASRELASYVEASKADPKLSVQRFASPQEIEDALFAAGASIPLKDGESPVNEDALIKACKATLDYSIRTSSPLYFNQLYARVDEAGLVGDWLTAAAHCNVHTYEAAPVFTVIERAVLSKLARLWLGPSSSSSAVDADGTPAHEGLFVPGGSIANLYGLLLARHAKRPDARTAGLAGGKPLVAFTSSEAHYSYKKSMVVAGLGLDNLVHVRCDATGAMDPTALREAVQQARDQGKEPFFVGATAGTTVLGAYDPFDAVADICREEGLWMHIDAAWGCSALLSPKLRERHMRGAERADSLTFDAHKMMGLPIQCAAFLSRGEHDGTLAEHNATAAAYLFQPDKNNTELDLGDKTIQCGRRADAFKLWMAWKARGDAGWAKSMEHCWELAQYVEQRASDPADNRFALVAPSSCTNVVFWWVPSALRPADGSKFDASTADESTLAALSLVAPRIKDRMQREGDALIGFQPVMGNPNCFRIVFSSTDGVTTQQHVADMLERIDAYGEEIFGANMPSKP